MIGRNTLMTGVLAGTMLLSGDSAPATVPVQSRIVQCSTLSSFNEIGAGKDGNENAVNTGSCADIYNPFVGSPTTYQTVGHIATGEAFEIECSDGPKSTSFRVENAQGVVGDVNLAGIALQRYLDGTYTHVPIC